MDINFLLNSLTCAILCSGKYILARQCYWDRSFLNRRRFVPTFFENSHQQFPLQTKFLKFVSFSISHVLQTNDTIFSTPCYNINFIIHFVELSAMGLSFISRKWRGIQKIIMPNIYLLPTPLLLKKFVQIIVPKGC